MDKSAEVLLAETREAAIAIKEDFCVLEDVATKVETRPVDLRHASAILRRWLVENQLRRVASPRVGRLHVKAIDNNSIYRAARKGVFNSFVSGGASVHGVYLAAGMVSAGGRPPPISDYNPGKTEEFRLETFVKQRVIFFNAEWFTRQQVIKFVANAAHGVHGHGARCDWEKRLSAFRHEVSVSLTKCPDGEPIPTINWRTGNPAGEIDPERYDPSKVNGVLLEVLSTIHFLIKSSEVAALIESIEAELS